MLYENPTTVPMQDQNQLWDQLVDVVDDYFQIDREQRPARLQGPEGEVFTPGKLETFPEGGSTLLEPWRGDSVGFDQRLESTLQSIRRRCEISVFPTEVGYSVEVKVFKELEDLQKPEFATASSATVQNDNSIRRFTEAVGDQNITAGWIPLGRDVLLEQEIIIRLQERLSHPGGGSFWGD